MPPLDRIPQIKINEEVFTDAYEKMLQERFKIIPSKNSVEGFIIEVAKRNRVSRENGDDEYLSVNITATINQFSDIDNTNADAYRFVAGSYFGTISAQIQTEEARFAELIEEEGKSQLDPAAEAELLHEHGEERAEQMKKDLGY